MAAIVVAAVLLAVAVIVVASLLVYRDLKGRAMVHERRLLREERDYDVLMESVSEEAESETER